MLRKAGMQPLRYKLGFFWIGLPGLAAAALYLPLPRFSDSSVEHDGEHSNC